MRRLRPDTRKGGRGASLLHAPASSSSLSSSSCFSAASAAKRSRASTRSQGLTLVHFSAQPEPFVTQNTP